MAGEERRLAYQVGADAAGERLDVFLAGQVAGWTRSGLQRLIEGGLVQVDGRPVRKAGYRLRDGEALEVTLPPLKEAEAAPEPIPLEIVYEDGDLLVVNKPRGLVVHPAAGHREGTLVNALLHHCRDLSGIGGAIRPGIVHRLDKDTSGLLVVAKNDLAHLGLAAQIKERSAHRVYLALVRGNLAGPAGTVEAPIGRDPKNRKKMAVTTAGRNREALTNYRVLERFGRYTLVEASLKTGRTHQIRVHLAYLGHPVAGDPVYAKGRDPWPLAGQLLHAGRLEFSHPRTGKRMEFSAPPPADFAGVLAKLRREKGEGGL